MADKAVSELVPAEVITATDLFVLEQNGTAKKLPGQVLLNWLTAAADGHGGISKIEKLKTSGLADTYRITLADTTTFDFVVNNGKSISNIAKTSTSGLVDTYTITYNDGAKTTFTVTNGAKGDKGDNTYVWVKYASQKPTASSSSFGDLPDDWIGIYYGGNNTAPTDWQQYKWFKIKGEKGDTGAPATLISASVSYQVSDSGTIIPSGNWITTIPVVAQGKYLWTRMVQTFNTGEPVTAYTISRMGLDGLGSVVSVANISPDLNGNVPLTPADIGALSVNGGDMLGGINMQGQSLTGLIEPTNSEDAANMGYVDKTTSKAGSPYNYLDNSDFTNPVNQRGATSYAGAKYGIDRWVSEGEAGVVSIEDGSVNMKSSNGSTAYITQFIEAGKIKSGKIYTVACQLTDGSVWLKSGTAREDMGSTVIKYMTYNGSEIGAIHLTYDTNKSLYKVMFSTTSTSGMDVVWVALYECEYTDDSFPKYQSEDYSAKLLECQRYFYRYLKYTMHPGYKSSTIYATIYIPAIMRTTPTVTGTFEYRGTLTATDAATHTGSIGSVSTESQGNTLRLIITEDSAKITNNQAIILMSYDVEISADL